MTQTEASVRKQTQTDMILEYLLNGGAMSALAGIAAVNGLKRATEADDD